MKKNIMSGCMIALSVDWATREGPSLTSEQREQSERAE